MKKYLSSLAPKAGGKEKASGNSLVIATEIINNIINKKIKYYEKR